MHSRALLLLLPLAGCDLVFGVTGEAEPCALGSFGAVTAVDVIPAEDFSFDWEETIGVVQADGLAFEIAPADATLTPIDLGPYMNQGLALTPEGNALFYTIVVEPPVLKGALRGTATWQLDADVPRGTFAGTPSADVFGPRRVFVKMRAAVDAQVQEYEDVAGRWTAVGEPFALPTTRAPQLSPDGLTMLYAASGDDPGIFAAQRPTTNEAFGAPVELLDGAFVSAQLTSRCSRLYTTDGSMLRRYDR